MKRQLEHPAPSPAEQLYGPRYWRSLDERAQSPEFRQWVEREFPAGASEMEGVNRRQFMRLMAASFALAGAGAAGCRRPESYLVGYGKQPERVIQGVPAFYASSFARGLDAVPIVVESHANRPTKIEGNPKWAPSGGATDLPTQASVLDLYDPDRATRSSAGTRPLNAAQAADVLGAIPTAYSATAGAGLAILAEPSSSPTRARLVADLRKKFPAAIFCEYAPHHYDFATQAHEAVFGQPVRAVADFAQAKRILSFDADFLYGEPGHVPAARAFSKARHVKSAAEADGMNRLYLAEARMSVTGTMADHRLRLPTQSQPALAALVLAEVLAGAHRDAALVTRLRQWAGEVPGLPAHWVSACASDLLEHPHHAVVVAGSHLPPVVHELVAMINEVLGAPGHTLRYVLPGEAMAAPLGALTDAIDRGTVKTLVIVGGNPAYNAPGSLPLAKLLEAKKVAEVIRVGYYFDETSAVSTHHIVLSHYLESWGDARTWDGTLVPVQPLTLPIFPSFSEVGVFARLLGLTAPDDHQLCIDTYAALAPAGVPYEQFLAEGFLAGSAFAPVAVSFKVPVLLDLLSKPLAAPAALSATSLEVVLQPSLTVGDGTQANNGWLQECPDPITKLTWDNVIQVSPKLAESLSFTPGRVGFLPVSAVKNATYFRGRQEAPIARLTVDGITITGPIYIQPGLADFSVVVSTGYGRRRGGQVCKDLKGNPMGFDAYPLVPTGSPFRTGAKIELTGAIMPIASTQEHWSMEGRDIVREANADYYKAHPDFAQHMGVESHAPANLGKDKDKPLEYVSVKTPRGNSLYEHPNLNGTHQWGMVIDLNTCIGCNACVVACQSENNIPIVGKDQVLRGREMHWIRLDRYYSSGDVAANNQQLPEDVQVSMMPVNCMQCENAPCEQVCPVNATVHDEEGLNVMAYNRCVGTRYCANNCPYKVRRFNFFDWNKRHADNYYWGPLYTDGLSDLQKQQKNPEVTIRMRGVMEKCTYCQQRIENAKIAQKAIARDSDNVRVPEGIIKTACQQVCPAGAITFGDLLDTNSEVYQLKQSDRNYSLLGYLNVRPRTTYLARLRNPNKAMLEGFQAKYPNSYIEYRARSAHPLGAHDEKAGAAHGSAPAAGHGGGH